MLARSQDADTPKWYMLTWEDGMNTEINEVASYCGCLSLEQEGIHKYAYAYVSNYIYLFMNLTTKYLPRLNFIFNIIVGRL